MSTSPPNETGNSNPGLIYIAGYGRSGSTLLDSLLNDHPSILGAGEAMWLFHQVVNQLPCSCGEQLTECPLWGGVLQDVARVVGHSDWRRMATVTLGTERLLSRNRQPAEYRQLWNAVFQAVAKRSGAAWVVDSSKSTRLDQYRLPLLANQSDLRVRVIHLVRDPRAVMWSSARGSNRKLERGTAERKHASAMLKGLVSWAYSNFWVENLCWRNAHWQLLRIRYEDLVTRTEATLAELGQFLDCDLSGVSDRVAQGASLAAGHGIAGNRMRRSGKIVLRLDREWETRLPRPARWCSQLAWPFLRRYQY